jgi:hypothetical protein
MTTRDIDRLVIVSRLLLDVALSDLETAARACAESRQRIAALSAPPAPDDLPVAIAARTALRYEVWAEARRAEINLTLARQTAEWLEARSAARRAFGRAEAIRTLAGRR